MAPLENSPNSSFSFGQSSGETLSRSVFITMSVAGNGAASSSSSRPASADTAAVASTGYHLLVVDGYSRTKRDTPNGKCIPSCHFIVGGYRWRIEYYPNGDNKETAGSVCFRLSLDEDDVAEAEPLKVRFSFCFVGRESRVAVTEPREFSSRCRSWGSKQPFMKTEALEKSKHLNGDGFAIRCDIVITKDGNTGGAPAPQCAALPPLDIQQHLKNLLLSGMGADVAFEVGGETLAAHRCVLATRSPVFAAELFGPMKEGTTSTSSAAVRIDDMEARVFKLLLEFVYSDTVPEMMEEEEGKDAKTWQDLLVAADRYDLQRLRLICEEKLRGFVGSGTVATILALAEQHHCQGLEACFEFLRDPANLQQVMAGSGLYHLTRTCPSVLKELVAKLYG